MVVGVILIADDRACFKRGASCSVAGTHEEET